MSVGLLRLALLLLTLGGLGATVIASTRPVVWLELPEPHRAAEVPPPLMGQQHSEEMLERAVDRPAFRADRRRPTVTYDRNGAPAWDIPPSPAMPKPALAVSGILWGPDPAALIEGVPGAEGSVVLRRGDSIAGLRMMRIDDERVVIRGMDTTWNLMVRNPWP